MLAIKRRMLESPSDWATDIIEAALQWIVSIQQNKGLKFTMRQFGSLINICRQTGFFSFFHLGIWPTGSRKGVSAVNPRACWLTAYSTGWKLYARRRFIGSRSPLEDEVDTNLIWRENGQIRLVESAWISGRLATRKKCADQATQPSRISVKKCDGMDGSGIWKRWSKKVVHAIGTAAVSRQQAGACSNYTEVSLQDSSLNSLRVSCPHDTTRWLAGRPGHWPAC